MACPPVKSLGPSKPTDSFTSARKEATSVNRHPDGRFVTVSTHKDSDTFTIKTLRIMILRQARWTEDDLRRLDLLK